MTKLSPSNPHPLELFSIEEHELATQDAFCLTRRDIFLDGGAKRYALIQEALTTFKQPILTRKIGSALLTAQARSLRTVQLMAARGYPQEAATLARMALERGFVQAFISADEGQAKRWTEHALLDKPFEPFFNCVQAIGKRWYASDPVQRQQFQDAEKALYAEMSSYTHNNPLTTKLLDLRVVDGEVTLSTLPDPTPESFIRCATIFLAAQRAAELSLHAFVEVFPSTDADRADWQQKIERLSQERNAQHAELKAIQHSPTSMTELKRQLDQRRNMTLSQIQARQAGKMPAQ